MAAAQAPCPAGRGTAAPLWPGTPTAPGTTLGSPLHCPPCMGGGPCGMTVSPLDKARPGGARRLWVAKATCVPELPAFEAWKPSLAHGPADSSPLFQAGSRLRPAWAQPAWPTGPTWQPRALRQTSAPGHRPAAPSALASPPAPARPGSGSPPPWNKAAAPLPSPGQGAPVQVLPSRVQGARGSVCGLSPDGGPSPPETTCPCLPGTGRAPRTGDRALDPQHPPRGFQRTFPRGLRHRTPTRRA